MTQAHRRAAAIGASLALALAVVLAAALFDWADVDILNQPDRLAETIRELGWIGPLAVIALITMAIVVSPLPSAPIAMVSGALYGHVWGTVWVILGAEIGALIAFSIARFFGYGFVRRWLGERIRFDSGASQNVLTAIVFLSRLLPFLSFDVVSYAAGLTPLRAWRFALATLAGIVPMSFLLAHFGGEFASLDTGRIAMAGLAFGGVTLLPLVLHWSWRRCKSARATHRTTMHSPPKSKP